MLKGNNKFPTSTSRAVCSAASPNPIQPRQGSYRVWCGVLLVDLAPLARARSRCNHSVYIRRSLHQFLHSLTHSLTRSTRTRRHRSRFPPPHFYLVRSTRNACQRWTIDEGSFPMVARELKNSSPSSSPSPPLARRLPIQILGPEPKSRDSRKTCRTALACSASRRSQQATCGRRATRVAPPFGCSSST